MLGNRGLKDSLETPKSRGTSLFEDQAALVITLKKHKAQTMKQFLQEFFQRLEISQEFQRNMTSKMDSFGKHVFSFKIMAKNHEWM